MLRILNIIFLNRGKDQHGDDVVKAYTPTTLDSDLGYFELVIKVYIQHAIDALVSIIQ